MIQLDDDGGGDCDVPVECMFAPYGFADAFRFYGTRVNASCKIIIYVSGLTENSRQHFEGALSEFFSPMYAQSVHFLCRDTSHSPKGFDGKPVDEILCLVGMDGAESVGLAVIRCYLGQEFVVRDACRCYKVQLFADALLDFLGNIYRQRDAFLVLGHVQKSFVQLEWFYQVCIFVEDGMNLC